MSNMSWQEILVKLHELHEARKSMSNSSIYHGTYQATAIKLNTELYWLTNKNYIDFSQQDIDEAIVEFKMLKEK